MLDKAPSFVLLAFSDGVPQTAFAVSLIVGTILNLINQGDALFGDAPVDGVKLVLTYVVPYLDLHSRMRHDPEKESHQRLSHSRPYLLVDKRFFKSLRGLWILG